jgi:hypothetical protein
MSMVFAQHRDEVAKHCLKGFEVLTVVSTKMAVFWVVPPSSGR